MSRPAAVQEHLRGQLFIAGALPERDATITIRLVDATVQDVAAKELSRTTVHVAGGKARSWVGFGLSFSWPDRRQRFDMAHLSIQADIKVGDKLTHLTKVSHRVDLTGQNPAAVTVVVEPV